MGRWGAIGFGVYGPGKESLGGSLALDPRPLPPEEKYGAT